MDTEVVYRRLQSVRVDTGLGPTLDRVEASGIIPLHPGLDISLGRIAVRRFETLSTVTYMCNVGGAILSCEVVLQYLPRALYLS